MRVRFHPANVLAALTAALVLLSARDALGSQRYWVGPVGGLWSDPQNWSATEGGPGGAGVPQAGDVANSTVITAVFDYAYSAPVGLTLGSPNIQQNSPSTMLVTVNTLNLPRFLQPSGTGSWTQSAGANVITTQLRLGQNADVPLSHTVGYYTLSGNATLSVGTDLLVPAGTYTQSGGLCTIPISAQLGDIFTSPKTPGGIAMSGGTLNVGTNIIQNWGASTFSGGVTTTASLSVFGGSVTLSGGMLSVGTMYVNAGAQFVQTGGTLPVPQGITLDNLSVYRFDGGSLSVGSISATGGRLFVGPGADRIFRTGGFTLTLGGNTRVDLNQGATLVDYATTSPISTVRTYIVSGRNSGSWNGSGISSSFAAANAEFSVGLAEASAIFSIFPATFRGQSVDDTTVIVATVRTGDANLDGKIDLADFNRLASNFGGVSGKIWSQGDFNYDGQTNLTDFNLLAGNFGLSAGADGVVDPSDWAALAAAVPEPAAISLPFAAVIALHRRRRRSIFIERCR
jgi:hypothetical protein